MYTVKNVDISGITFLMIYSYTELCFSNIHKSKIYTMHLVVLGLKVSSAVLILLQMLLRYKRFTKAFRQLYKVDVQIKKLNNTKQPLYTYYYLYFLLFYICCPLFYLVYMIFMHDNETEWYAIFWKYFSQGIQHDINIMVTNYFFFYVITLRQRFSFINEQIATLNNASMLHKKRQSANLLRILTKMHEDLCKGGRYINEVMQLPLFCIIVFQLVEFIFLLYMVYHGEKTNIVINSVSYLLQMVNMLTPSRLAKIEVKHGSPCTYLYQHKLSGTANS